MRGPAKSRNPKVPDVKIFPTFRACVSEENFCIWIPDNVRGNGYHHSDTRVWGDMPGTVVAVVIRFDHGSDALSSRVVRVPLPYTISSVCRQHELAESDKRSDFPILG